MSDQSLVASGHRVLHSISMVLILVIGLAAIAYTLACAFGFAPWLTFTATFGDILRECIRRLS